MSESIPLPDGPQPPPLPAPPTSSTGGGIPRQASRVAGPLEPIDLEGFGPGQVTTRQPGRAIDAGQGRVFPCDACGADLKFHIGMQVMECPYCGHRKDIVIDPDAVPQEQDFHAMLERIQQWRWEAGQANHGATGPADLNEVRCGSCGGNVEFLGTLTSTKCPYCASPVQLEHAHKCDQRRIPVDGMLPFLVDRQLAGNNLQQWVRSRWFAPNDFLQQGAQGNFNGVYLSYFTFDTLTATAYDGQRGEYYYVTVGSGKDQKRERRTRWYRANGHFQLFFDDVLVLANTGLKRDMMLNLEPWPLGWVVPFNQQMLAGLMARTYDIDLDHCFLDAKARIDTAIATDVKSRIGGDTQRVHSIRTEYEAITFKHLLLPVWLLIYRYKNRPYQIFINAATGQVQGERPYSVWKILGVIFAGIAIVAAVLAAFGLFEMLGR